MKQKKNNKGMAMVEAMPILLVMFVLMGATLGSWGIVHTAILNSIAARNSLFFYFNNRSDLSYIRDWDRDLGPFKLAYSYFRKDGVDGIGKRFSFIISEKIINSSNDNPKQWATLRRLAFDDPDYDITNMQDRSEVANIQGIEALSRPDKNTKKTAKKDSRKSRAWVMVGYGICLSADCGH